MLSGTIHIMANNTCLQCNKNIRPRQEAFQCDGCFKWQHRTCGTGISRAMYWATVRGDGDGVISWYCANCTNPNLQAPDQELNLSSIPESPIRQEPPTVFEVSAEVHPIPANIQNGPLNSTTNSTRENQNDDSNVESEDHQYQRDHSFDISNRDIAPQIPVVEQSIVDERPADTIHEFWWCSVRSKALRCPATVIQTGDAFRIGPKEHVHPSKPGIHVAVKMISEVKQKAKENVFRSAASIVQETMASTVEVAPPSSRPDPSSLQRRANRARQKMRPKDPTDLLTFEVNTDFLPDNFYRTDVTVGERRHFIFATDAGLDTLSSAKRWYLDGTFKIVRAPVTQLFTIHAFIRSGDDLKQIPLVFVLMSGKRKRDYRNVLKAVKRMMPAVPVVESMVTDFEAGIWQAIRKVFPNVTIHGCVFHWTQAVWRKVQELGLTVAYREDNGTCLSFWLFHSYLQNMSQWPSISCRKMHQHQKSNNLRSTWN